jgi:hypothetical protein
MLLFNLIRFLHHGHQTRGRNALLALVCVCVSTLSVYTHTQFIKVTGAKAPGAWVLTGLLSQALRVRHSLGILTGSQLTLSRHYWAGIWHGGALGVHESLWVRERFW